MLRIFVALAQLADTGVGIEAQRIPTMSNYTLKKGADWCLLESPAPNPVGTYIGFLGTSGKGIGWVLSNPSWTSLQKGQTNIVIRIGGKDIEGPAITGSEDATNGRSIGTIYIPFEHETFLALYRVGAEVEFRKGDSFLSRAKFDTQLKLAFVEFSACMEGAKDPFAAKER